MGTGALSPAPKRPGPEIGQVSPSSTEGGVYLPPICLHSTDREKFIVFDVLKFQVHALNVYGATAISILISYLDIKEITNEKNRRGRNVFPQRRRRIQKDGSLTH
jgi:hypothetical protein